MTDKTSQQCAAVIMDTFHMMMRNVMSEARKHVSSEISIQQFRTMKIIENNEGASLSLVSERLGATLSAASKIVDGLVEHGYISRDLAEDDRRRLILSITDTGKRAVESVHLETIVCLADKLSGLSTGECAMLNLAMDILRSAFIQ